MSTENAAGWCPLCNAQVLVVRQTPNHVLHLVITLFLCGLWIPVWIFLALFPKPWRCGHCGAVVREIY